MTRDGTCCRDDLLHSVRKDIGDFKSSSASRMDSLVRERGSATNRFVSKCHIHICALGTFQSVGERKWLILGYNNPAAAELLLCLGAVSPVENMTVFFARVCNLCSLPHLETRLSCTHTFAYPQHTHDRPAPIGRRRDLRIAQESTTNLQHDCCQVERFPLSLTEHRLSRGPHSKTEED